MAEFERNVTMPNILCCLCGVSIQSNPTNMCTNCMQSQVDLSTGISKQLTVLWCRGCGRYNRTQWIVAERESRALLDFLLKKIKGLGKETKVVDADFVYTEPHSMRLKVRLTVQKEVYVGAILQQQFIVEYVISPMQCPDCARSYTEHQWDTVVQARQKVRHKRTFYFLEQLLLKHNICMKAISIKEENGGLDFHWGSRQDANVLTQFLAGVIPCRQSESKRLISHNEKEGTAHFKFVKLVEIVPICKGDVVILPRHTAQAFGGVTEPLLCWKVSAQIHLIDPVSLRTYELSSQVYWRTPFQPILTASQMTEFAVLDIERADEVRQRGGKNSHHHGNRQYEHKKFGLAEIEIARASDFGVNDNTTTIMTHLGHILRVGDACMGYNLATANINSDAQLPKNFKLPEVIIVKKHYHKTNRASKRKFKLKELAKAQLDNRSRAQDEKDYEEFLQDVEEDPEIRGQINLFKSATVTRSINAAHLPQVQDEEMSGSDDEDFPEIPMEELLDAMEQSKVSEEPME